MRGNSKVTEIHDLPDVDAVWLCNDQRSVTMSFVCSSMTSALRVLLKSFMERAGPIFSQLSLSVFSAAELCAESVLVAHAAFRLQAGLIGFSNRIFTSDCPHCRLQVSRLDLGLQTSPTCRRRCVCHIVSDAKDSLHPV